VPVATMRLVSRGQPSAGPPGNAAAAFAIPFVLMFLMMMIAMMGSAPMLTVVAEDKMQRVFEMLLASAKPFELIAGKVLASVGVSLTSSVFYIAGGLFVLQGMALMGIAPFDLLPWFFVYLICEVVILSSLGAALGSACSTPNDAQQYVFFVIMPVIAPVFFIGPLMEQPNGLMATVASLIPPFTPLIMMMRQAMPGGVPAWEPWAGLVGVLAWTLLSTFAAARIFRVGILMQGQAPKLPEMFRWALRG
jgi:ABC-2 type transport system permease protein